MLARVAENLYWLGRYLERADNQARLIDVQRLAGSEIDTSSDGWEFVLDTLGADSAFEEAQSGTSGLTAAEYLVHSPTSPYSIRSTVTSARTLATELREHSSREVFEAINRLYLAIQPGKTNGSTNGVGSTMQQIRNSVATAFGLFENTVLHSEGAHWFRIGQLLERADMTSRIVDAKYFMTLPEGEEIGGAVDRHQWRSVLRSASALEAYHKSYLGSIRVDRALQLLFLNPEFPRSLMYCINAMRDEFLLATAETPPSRSLAPATDLAVVQLDLSAQTGDSIVIQGLHEFIDNFQATLIRVDKGLTENLFRALPVESPEGNGELSRTESLQK